MSPLMVVADGEGNLFEHPELEMVGAQGAEPVAPEPEELSPSRMGASSSPSRAAFPWAATQKKTRS